MFEWREVNQIGIVVRDLKKTLEHYWKVLHVGPWELWTFAPPNLKDATYRGKPAMHKFRLAETMVGSVQIELIEPLEGPTIYQEFLDKKGEGLHHIKQIVPLDRLESTLKHFKSMGIEVIQSGRYDDDYFYNLDTEKLIGIILEIGYAGGMRPGEARYP
ncbi:MAG: VOC family protein [Candidatus Bathyarchaeia archaeon]